jgi:hypothetical protein
MDTKKYKFLHQLSTNKKFDLYNKQDDIFDERQLAEYINKNLDSLGVCEKLSLLKKIINEHNINRQLLKFEMEHLIPDKKETREEIILLIDIMFKKYHKRAGGFLFEDDDWNFFDFNSKKYLLNENEIIFDNSLKYYQRHDIETNKFIDNMISLISKISNDIKIKDRLIIDESNNILWVVIICTFKK